MGTFAGHIVPGTCFIIVSIWWIFNAYRRYYKCICKKKKFRSSTTYTLNDHQNFPIESVVKFLLVVLGISGETYTAFDKNGVFVHFENGQHISMFFFFGLHAVIEILQFYKFTFVPPFSEYASASLAFFMEALLFYLHIHGRSHLDMLVHQLLVVAIAGCCITTAGEAFISGQVIVPLIRAFFVLLQGTWFYHVGFILYPPFPSMRRWDEEDHTELMLIVMFFTWHVAADLCAVLLIGALVSFKYRKLLSCNIPSDTAKFHLLRKKTKRSDILALDEDSSTDDGF